MDNNRGVGNGRDALSALPALPALMTAGIFLFIRE
jgi:hypothetical protein